MLVCTWLLDCSDLKQADRDTSMRRFRDGEVAVLVATAVAARGLDIVGVDHVINYDLPTHIDDYVHRIGRTGRVGNPGRATAFFDPEGSSDSRLRSQLIECIRQAQQTPPDWLVADGGTQGDNFGGASSFDNVVVSPSFVSLSNRACISSQIVPSTGGDDEW